MSEKYDLKEMLAEIEKDRTAARKKDSRMSQDEIKKMFRKNRKPKKGPQSEQG